MEKKHQVFVSSTYIDLVEERRAVIQALLELDCIPAGMELFPAADEDAWTLIKEVIDSCDYYVLIVAGKYGSTNSDGIGYTELEYDYAVSIGKPVIAFVHEDVESLPASKVEKAEKSRDRLSAFTSKAKKKHCKFWNGADDLGAKVSRSLISLRKKHPSDGWVRGKYAADDSMLRELEQLRRRVAELKLETEISAITAPEGSERFAQGEETFPISTYVNTGGGKGKNVTLHASWDKLFSYCGPSLIGECEDKELVSKISLCYFHQLEEEIRAHNVRDDLVVPYVSRDAIKVQFQALGLMRGGTKRRAVSDTKTYWALTPYGQRRLIEIRAIRK